MNEKRECGSCTLCCKLLPVLEIKKLDNQQCQYQNFDGCSIYQNRPHSCSTWSCMWLLGRADVRRPNISHYVIDISPDYISAKDDITTEYIKIPAIQIWCDPKYPNAYDDKDLMAFLDGVNKTQETVGLVRFDAQVAIVLIPPKSRLNDSNRWIQSGSGLVEKTHSANDIVDVLNLTTKLDNNI